MKKGIAIALVVIAVGVSAGYFFMYPHGKTVTVDTGFAEYLPADTVAVISLRDINGTVDNFPDTPLGKFLSQETMTRIMTDMGAGAEDIQAYNDGYDKLFGVLRNPAFRMVFGDDVDFAVLPVEKSLFMADISKALKQSLLLLATTSSADMIETSATKILKKSVEEFSHGSLTMTRVTLEDGSFVFAYTDNDRLLVALDPGVIEKSLQQRKSGVVLAKNKNFLDAVEFWEQTPLELVQNRAFFQSDFVRQMLLAAEDKEVQRVGEYLRGIHFIASVGGRNQGRWQEESVATFVYDELDPLIKESVRLSLDSRNETLNLLNVNPLAYSWMVDSGTSSFLEGMRTDKEVYAEMDALVKKELGVGLEDLVKSFGPQHGMALNRIVQTGVFPLPELVFAIQVSNRELIANVLGEIQGKMSEQGLVVEQQEVDGQAIYSWPILPGEAAQPAIVLTDDMLYFSNGLSELKKTIALGEKSQKVPESVVQALGADLSDKVRDANSGVAVLWPARLSAQLDGLASWGVSMLEGSQGIKAGLLKDELLRLIGSSEVIVITSSVTRDRGYGSVFVVDSQE
jgi:hypothetical protein